MSSLPDRLWYDEGRTASLARGLLAPTSWLYSAVAQARNALYDGGVLREHLPALPALSVGNLTVGGTGKTPVAAWAARRLLDAGAHPAIVLRGYGNDEPLVHERLNAAAIVIADADRVRGVRTARARGADCVVLDDAFQHRRIRRLADWVLVSAERWRGDSRTLPAGPLREPLAALERADLLLITRKTASVARAEEVAGRMPPRFRGGAARLAILHLAADALVAVAGGDDRPLAWLEGRSVVAVAAIGAPDAFFGQLEAAGARVVPTDYPDHHAYSEDDVRRFARLAERQDGIVCTLKDAVKLAPLWPRAAPPLWYVSQRAVVERGSAAIESSLALVLSAREGVSSTAGPAGQSSPAHGHRSSTSD